MKQQSTLPKVNLYSDGGASPNPGKGGYGIILECQGVEKEFYKGFQMTTNNRMELMGVITGLEKLQKKSKVDIYTDSQYTINGIQQGWAEKWSKNNWYRTKGQKAINHDLWKKLLDLIQNHEVKFHWIKGHNGHPENERCDELATIAMQGDSLLIDENYQPGESDQMELSVVREVQDTKKVSGKGDPSLKVDKEGDMCRKCGTPVIKKKPKHTKKTLLKSYYYEYYFSCPGCKTNYMIEEAKRDISTLRL